MSLALVPAPPPCVIIPSHAATRHTTITLAAATRCYRALTRALPQIRPSATHLPCQLCCSRCPLLFNTAQSTPTFRILLEQLPCAVLAARVSCGLKSLLQGKSPWSGPKKLFCSHFCNHVCWCLVAGIFQTLRANRLQQQLTDTPSGDAVSRAKTGGVSLFFEEELHKEDSLYLYLA